LGHCESSGENGSSRGSNLSGLEGGKLSGSVPSPDLFGASNVVRDTIDQASEVFETPDVPNADVLLSDIFSTGLLKHGARECVIFGDAHDLDPGQAVGGVLNCGVSGSELKALIRGGSAVAKNGGGPGSSIGWVARNIFLSD